MSTRLTSWQLLQVLISIACVNTSVGLALLALRCWPCAVGLALLALRCWPCRHKACRNACVALACVQYCAKNRLLLQIFIFYTTISLCCGIMLCRAFGLASTKRAFLHVLCFDVCNRSTTFRSAASLTFCSFRLIAAKIAALLTEPTQHFCRLCSRQQPSTQHNLLLCCTPYF